jgi:phospholipid transport system transporter-binding protein
VSEAVLESLGAGRFRVAGDLTYETVASLLEEDTRLFAGGPEAIEVDLSGVGRTTSVGLALMLKWLRQARSGNIAISFSHVPAQILGIAKLSQLESILGLDEG